MTYQKFSYLVLFSIFLSVKDDMSNFVTEQSLIEYSNTPFWVWSVANWRQVVHVYPNTEGFYQGDRIVFPMDISSTTLIRKIK